MVSLVPSQSFSLVEALVDELSSKAPVARERARKALVAMSSPEVVEALSAALSNPRVHARWEAAKALISLADSSTSDALVRALEDENEGVRWLASEALIALGYDGVMAVLKAVTQHAGSLPLCEGAHHVLRAVDCGPSAAILAPVLAALHEPQTGIAVPMVAYRARRELEEMQHSLNLCKRVKPDVRWD